MSDNSQKSINNIKLGDNILSGGKVLSILETEHTEPFIFEYLGVKVTANHFVYENNIWKRVKNSDNAIVVPYDIDRVYCLITEKHSIISKNIKFSDFEATDSPNMGKKWDKLVLYKLNNIDFNIEIEKSYSTGFTSNTHIKMKDGNYKKIIDISIGDYCSTGKVIGKVFIDNNNISLYKYKLPYQEEIIVSGTTKVKEYGLWIMVYQSMYATKYKPVIDSYISILTESNVIETQNYSFRDYMEIKNKYHQLFDNEIVIRLNQKK